MENITELQTAVTEEISNAEAQYEACDLLDDDMQIGLYVKRPALKSFSGNSKDWPTWSESICVGLLENELLI